MPHHSNILSVKPRVGAWRSRTWLEDNLEKEKKHYFIFREQHRCKKAKCFTLEHLRGDSSYHVVIVGSDDVACWGTHHAWRPHT